MGVVYYANYLRWFEKGRSEWLRQVGLPYGEIEQQGFHFPVAEVSCRYSHPAHYDEVVKIETDLAELGRATLTFSYRITRETDDVLLATGSTKHACIDHAGRMARMPKSLEDAIAFAQT
jgi:acyl-CoA thioester hydrolase